MNKHKTQVKYMNHFDKFTYECRVEQRFLSWFEEDSNRNTVTDDSK